MKKSTTSLLFIAITLLVFSYEKEVVEPDETSTPDENSVYIEKEIDTTWDSENATRIVLQGNEVEITGEGALFESEQITIFDEGDYYFTGDLTQGSVKIATDELKNVKLILDGASITSSDNACIYVESAKEVTILLPVGSVNYLTDNSTYTSKEQNAVIYATTDVAIAGEGKLTVQANHNDGITSIDGLVIDSGNFEINSIDDGIRGKDYLVIKDGTFTINSGGDAIKSDNEDEGFGTIAITTGVFDITAKADGIAAQSDLKITNGTFTIGTYTNGDTSAKALKAGELLSIEYGVFNLESEEDAVHSNSDISILDGDFTIDAGDDALHADRNLEIDNATITINTSLEGLEAGYITVNDGAIVVNATDDGFNATQGSEVMSDDGSQLVINGGTITVNMSGNDVDALDSNGDITINGGTLNLTIPTSGPSESLDANGTITIDTSATVYENGEIYTEGSSGGGPGGR